MRHLKAEILIFGAFLLAAGLFQQPVEYDNTLVRFLAVRAVADNGRLDIAPWHKSTIDAARYNGHYYSSKAFGASLLALPAYWAVRLFTPQAPTPWPSPLQRYLVTLVASGLPSALLAALLFHTARILGAGRKNAFLMVLAYGTGTVAWSHATIFSGHQAAAAAAFFSFALLHHALGAGRRRAAAVFFYSGLTAGFAAVTEYTLLLWIPIGALYALMRGARGKALAAFAAGIVPWLVLLGLYNNVCFGSPLAFSYTHLAFTRWAQGIHSGLYGFNLPSLRAAAALLAHPARGLFFISPVLLLSSPGLAVMIRRKETRPEGILCATMLISWTLLISSLYCWHGGWTYGPRYLVVIIPFAAFPMAFYRFHRLTFTALYVVSLFQCAAAVAGIPHTPQQIANPLREIILPCLGYGYMARNAGTLLGLPPLASLAFTGLLLGTVLWSVYRRVTAESPTEEAPRPGVSRRETILFACLAVIISSLALVRTPEREKVHYLRWRLLRDAARVTASPRLAAAARREYALLRGYDGEPAADTGRHGRQP